MRNWWSRRGLALAGTPPPADAMANRPPAAPLPPWLEAFRAGLDASVVETHISWLLLAGDRAYKLKKPITLPFLDYGSADRRRFFCQEELRLNRRFAPDLYQDVIPVAGSGEWAVCMRRFAEAQRLDHVCARGALNWDRVAELAAVIAGFQAAAPVAGAEVAFGDPDRVRAPMIENFTELIPLLPEAGPRLAALQGWTVREFARRRPALAARKAAGFVREGHGDLHLGNLALIDGRVTPFDCIEFNAELRWIDVASELAFTYVDLLDHRRADLAAWLVHEWLQRTGDYSAGAVLRLYAVYRALVRAKVAALRGDADEAGDYLAMAAGLAQPPPPGLVITHGLSASGKTLATIRRLRADPAAATLALHSDVERKRLHGLGPTAASGSGLATGIYSREASRRTYDRLRQVAGELLDSGWSVLVDATFLERAERDRFRALATDRGCFFGILPCTAPVAELRRRIAARRDGVSEATAAVLEAQLARVEPLAAAERAWVIEDPGGAGA